MGGFAGGADGVRGADQHDDLCRFAGQRLVGWKLWLYAQLYQYLPPVHSGSDSISVTITNAYGGIGLSHSSLTDTGFASVSFWLNGGAVGGQQLQMYGTLNFAAQSARYHLAAPLANTWQQYTVSLSALGVANTNNFTGFVIQDSAGSTEPTFYLDDIQLNAALPPPSVVHFTINAGQPIRTADARWFGLNAAVWDGYYDTPTTVSLLNQLGTRLIRLPGGSLSDEYHWVLDQSGTNTFRWGTSFANFIHVITNASVNAQAIITVNYGTGTPQEAAAWVAYCNAATTSTVSLGVDAKGTNWQTAGIGRRCAPRRRWGLTMAKTFSASHGPRRWVSRIGKSAMNVTAAGKPTAIPWHTTPIPTPCAPPITWR